ncbi:MAG: hypothetical protein ACK4S4_03140 [Pyrinomonadaceae bacterium]
MWQSRTKHDLMIEVWEKLDCESVGAAEIEAIESAVEGRFGRAAVESPMRIARLLADEGAVLRHAEIMQLWVIRREAEIGEARSVESLMNFESFDAAVRTIDSLEARRRSLAADNERDALRELRSHAIEAKKKLLAAPRSRPAAERRRDAEIAQWLTIWLQTPELWQNWIRLRRASSEFKKVFGNDNG